MVSKRLLYLVRRWLTKKTKRKSPINSWPWIRSQLYRILLNPKTDRIHLQISAAISTSSPKKWLTSGELSSSKAFSFFFVVGVVIVWIRNRFWWRFGGLVSVGLSPGWSCIFTRFVTSWAPCRLGAWWIGFFVLCQLFCLSALSFSSPCFPFFFLSFSGRLLGFLLRIQGS